jgi:hypothetical protein
VTVRAALQPGEAGQTEEAEQAPQTGVATVVVVVFDVLGGHRIGEHRCRRQRCRHCCTCQEPAHHKPNFAAIVCNMVTR